MSENELTGAAGDLVETLKEIDPHMFNIEYHELENMEEFGGGNFGEIYKGNYFGTTVAVKRLLDVDDEDMHKYIERETVTLRDLRHPNVVQLLGLCKHQTGIFIVTEFVRGGDLRKVLKNTARHLPWSLRCKIASDVAAAMAYLHSRSIIHRDLKAANLLVGDNWRIKVCDFGFCRDINTEEYMTLCGTDQWMAPEVMLGDKYNQSADVFSFAMVLIELITRSKPPPRNPGRAFALDTDAFLKQVPDDCPKRFVEIALQCGEFYPENRPTFRGLLPSFKSLVAELEEKELAEQKKKREQQQPKPASSNSLSDQMSYMSLVVEEEDDDDDDDEGAPAPRTPSVVDAKAKPGAAAGVAAAPAATDAEHKVYGKVVAIKTVGPTDRKSVV
eukprot:TRINITY_DN941_c0_g1_i2.p1 TRINITY_DN941_c0_g1~~TRINITY_DN941_c0_g1_i2.p1  ORF type:complete len:387 (-),score=111.37 TRINITY_DN941_c0_g1_i2:105-1265(-)